VSVAAEKIAKLLKLPMEVVSFREEFNPIYVYYKNGDEEPIPIFCDKGGEFEMQDVYKALRNMMFVLSFHPKHPALKQIRKELTLFS
jgi:tRNA U34 2-thiouridine synthase MnmA/TrmU